MNEGEINGLFVHAGPPDINLPLFTRPSLPPLTWNDILDIGLAPQAYEHEVGVGVPKLGWKVPNVMRAFGVPGFSLVSTSDLFSMRNRSPKLSRTVMMFLSLANPACSPMFSWFNMTWRTFTCGRSRKSENALGKMQLRSYMNGHSRPGEWPFPFSVDRGFVRSHRMQRKHYRGLFNPQCLHWIEVVHAPNLSNLGEEDRKRWMEHTGRGISFSIPLEASDFGSWRNLSNSDLELEGLLPPEKANGNHLPHKHLNGCGLNLPTQPSSDHSNGDVVDLSPKCNKRKRDFFPNGEDLNVLNASHSDRGLDLKIHQVEPSWLNDFSGVMKNMYGPVTAAKSLHEDEQGFLILVSLPFVELQTIKVTWKNTNFHGVVKVSCVSTACIPFIKRHDRTFKLTDPTSEHSPPGEFVILLEKFLFLPEIQRMLNWKHTVIRRVLC